MVFLERERGGDDDTDDDDGGDGERNDVNNEWFRCTTCRRDSGSGTVLRF